MTPSDERAKCAAAVDTRRTDEDERERCTAGQAGDVRTAVKALLLRLRPRTRGGGRGHESDTEWVGDGHVARGKARHLEEDPAEIAAAVLIGRALATRPGGLEQIENGSAALILNCASAAWVRPTAEALKRIFGSRSSAVEESDGGSRKTAPGAVVVPAGWERNAGRRSDENLDVGRALREHRALIGVAAPGQTGFPEELQRASDAEIALGVLEPQDLALITEHVVGAAPSTVVSADIANRVDPMDLRIAVHPARGPDATVKRLEQIVERRIRRPLQTTGPRLADLCGYGSAAEWGLAAANDLQAYARGDLSWSECDPGVLLIGPPGTGKTLFASALARQAHVDFLAGSLAQWQSVGEAHLGTTLKAMREFFRQARESSPCVALIDEIDSFGNRNGPPDHNRHYTVQLVNGFLECLDGDGGRAGVLLVGATNDAGRIDPAILRAGRFDRLIALEPPALDGLIGILRHHLGSDLADVDLGRVARRGLGGTGADCAAWVRRARGEARRAGRPIALEDLARSVAEAVPAACDEEEWRTAVHESGHAIVARSHGLIVDEMVMRSPRHGGAGYTRVRPQFDRTLATSRRMLAMLLAGRSAEILILGTPSAGAETDLAAATSLAFDMHFRWGLGLRLAVASRSVERSTGRLVELELRVAARKADAILETRREDLERVAARLLEKRSLLAGELDDLLDRR